MTSQGEKILGRWVTDPEDVKSLEELGFVSMEFQPNGNLTYTIHGEEKEQVMFLTYRIEGDVLVTDQPSSPKEERAPIRFTNEGKLIVRNGNSEFAYVRPQIK